jgi:hypothetical protein
MKIDSIQSRTQGSKKNSLTVRAGLDFSSKLTLGQVLKGKVLRSLEHGRYLVDFDGDEKVVDSVVSLEGGEWLIGRVVGLGPQVELQRIQAATPRPNVSPSAPQSKRIELSIFSGSGERLVTEMFQRYNALLSEADASALERQAGRVSDAVSMVLSGLVLSKLGLSINANLLQSLFKVLPDRTRRGLFPIQDTAIRLSKYRANAAPEDSSRALGELLQRLLERLPEARARPIGNELGDVERYPEAQAPRSLARWILNVQTGGAVAHRVTTLPLLIDEELVELDIALFDHSVKSPPEEEPAIAYRQVVMSLRTESLGAVELWAAFAGDRVRVNITSDSEDVSKFMSVYRDRLEADLGRLGWHVDEVIYGTRTADSASAVVRSVVDHLISPGSVSRLV